MSGKAGRRRSDRSGNCMTGRCSTRSRARNGLARASGMHARRCGRPAWSNGEAQLQRSRLHVLGPEGHVALASDHRSQRRARTHSSAAHGCRNYAIFFEIGPIDSRQRLLCCIFRRHVWHFTEALDCGAQGASASCHLDCSNLSVRAELAQAASTRLLRSPRDEGGWLNEPLQVEMRNSGKERGRSRLSLCAAGGALSGARARRRIGRAASTR